MDLFQIIYSWFHTYVFTANADVISDITYTLGSNEVAVNMDEWLCACATIITLSLLVAFLFLCVRWLFKLVAGLFTLRG